jgi:hypothetical protein
VLPDGSYDVFVVDATTTNGDTTQIALELTIVAGDHKGAVVTVHAQNLGVDELDLLGMPGALEVEGGVPTFSVER